MVANPNWLVEGKHREEMQRALTVSSAGSVLLQTTINKVIASLVLRYHGVINTLDHKQGSGDKAYVNRRNERDPSGEWVADTAAPGIVASTYTQASFTFRTYVSRGKVTRKLQATGRAYANVLAEEKTFSVEDHAEGLEDAFVTGNSAANANQLNGLLTLINAVSGQVVANTTANAGDAITLSKLDEALDLVRGGDNEKVIFASQLGARRLNSALQAQQQFNDRVEIAAGFRVRTYDDIPVIKTTSMPDTLVWNGSAGSITAFTGGSTTALVIVNRMWVWIEDLTPTSVLPLAKDSSQYDQFDIFTDTVLVLHNTKAASILGGIV